MDDTQTQNTVSEAPTQETPVVETPVVETQVAETTQTPEQTEGSEDAFTQFDPNQLTDPNLQAAYKQMQSDYTKKMQDISGQRAELEKLAPYKDFFNEMIKEREAGNRPPSVGQSVVAQLKEAGYDQQALDFAQQIVDAMDSHSQQQRAQETQVQEAQRIVSQVGEAGKLDPRLNDQSLVYKTASGATRTFGQIVEAQVAANPDWKTDAVAATKEAIELVDTMLGTAKQQGKVELSNQTKVKSEKFAPVNSSPQETIQSEGSMSVREAFALAQKQVGA